MSERIEKKSTDELCEKNDVKEKPPKIHYDPKAGFHSSRKSISSFSGNVEAEETGGVNQRYFTSRFVQQNELTITVFRRICKTVGMTNKEITLLVNKVKEKEGKQECQKIYYLPEDLFTCFISNPIGKRIVDNYCCKSWYEIVARFN